MSINDYELISYEIFKFIRVCIIILHRSIYVYIWQTEEGEDDMKKGTQLLEIYALEIQMYTAQKNNKKLKVSFVCYCFIIHVVFNVFVYLH